MTYRPAQAAIAVALAALIGCGDDEGSALSSNDNNCATDPNPTELSIDNKVPADGASVQNANISHGFLLKKAPGIIEAFRFTQGSGHTAGTLEPATISFSVTPEETHLRYAASGNRWTMEGEVRLDVADRYEAGGECYAFPSPLFSYSVTPDVGTGGGGMGGTGGNPGGGGMGGAGGTGGNPGGGGTGGTGGAGGSGGN